MPVIPELPPTAVFDGHNDAITRYSSGDPDDDWVFLTEVDYGHIDLPRARRGELVGGFFAICAPPIEGTWDPKGEHRHQTEGGFRVDLAPALDEDYAREFTDLMVTRLTRLDHNSEEVVLVRTADELNGSLERSAMAAVLHFEGAEAIDADLNRLYDYFELGLRSLGPVWSRPNVFATGVPFAFPSSPDVGPGLTEAGERLVDACNDLGIMIDLAHMNERGFWDVVGQTTEPVVVTHTAVHALAPTARNLTAKQIDAVAEADGVIGITFFVGDLRDDGRYDASTPLETLVRHIVHVAERVGVDHVALGSDFDGARIPTVIGDATGLPKLVAALSAAGFDDDELSRITHRNWLRVLNATLPSTS